MTVPPEERVGLDDVALAKERRRIRVLADLWAAHSQVTAPQDGPLVITQMVAELFALAENLFVEIERRAPAALPSGEAPNVIEALRACEEVLRLIHDAAGPVPKSAPMPKHSTFEAWKLAHDALNALLGSAPEKEAK